MGAAPYVTTWAAVIIGAVSAILTPAMERLLIRLRIDDPMCSISINLASGIWGMVAVGLFSIEDEVIGAVNGLFYGGGFHLLGVQCLGIVTTIAWGFGLGAVFFYGCKYFVTDPRVSEEVELQGLDLYGECGGKVVMVMVMMLAVVWCVCRLLTPTLSLHQITTC